MRLKLLIAIGVIAAVPWAVFAQDDEQDVSVPKPTIEEAEKLAQTISGDTNKLQSYCDLSKLQDQMEKAEEAKDAKTIDEILVKADALEQKLGPDFQKVSNGLDQVDPKSAEGRKFAAVFQPTASEVQMKRGPDQALGAAGSGLQVWMK
jgi:hypothetical protein